MSSCHDKDTDRLGCIGLCQDILNNVIFAFKMPLLSKRHLMTVVINMHKPYFQDMHCHGYEGISLMHTPSSKVLPIFSIK